MDISILLTRLSHQIFYTFKIQTKLSSSEMFDQLEYTDMLNCTGFFKKFNKIISSSKETNSFSGGSIDDGKLGAGHLDWLFELIPNISASLQMSFMHAMPTQHMFNIITRFSISYDYGKTRISKITANAMISYLSFGDQSLINSQRSWKH